MPPSSSPSTNQHPQKVLALQELDTTTNSVSSSSGGVKTSGSSTPTTSNNKNTSASDQKVPTPSKKNAKQQQPPQPASKKTISLKTKIAFRFGTFSKVPILSSIVRSNPVLVKLINPKTYNRIKIKTIRKDNKTIIVISKRKLFKP